MVTENECKQSLRNLENINLDVVLDELGYEKAEEISIYGINDYPTLEKQGDIEVLRELIKEHYENPPLEIEEIKKYEPVFDNEDLGWIIVSNINKSAKCIFCLDVDGNRHMLNFTDNRFYRKEVKYDDKILEKRMKTHVERVTGWGGEREIYLPDNMKFINYNIQSSNNIWCTYRPMREDEQAEVFIVQQSRTGLNSINGDGRFIVYESKDGVQAELSEKQLETIRGDTTN